MCTAFVSLLVDALLLAARAESDSLPSHTAAARALECLQRCWLHEPKHGSGVTQVALSAGKDRPHARVQALQV